MAVQRPEDLGRVEEVRVIKDPVGDVLVACISV